MLWDIEDNSIDFQFLGSLSPERILVDFEGPRSFISRDALGELLFAHQCGQADGVWRYAVVPFTEALEEHLSNGTIDIWTALDQSRLWLVDISTDWKVMRCFKSAVDRLPEGHRPKHGVTLHLEHNALLSIRAIGPTVEIGRATLGILRDQLESARTGLRLLAEAALGVFSAKGPPPKNLRNYYDLPALLLPGSVQVSVYPPSPAQQQTFAFDDTWDQMAKLLAIGLNGVISHSTSEFDQLDSETRLAVTKAVYSLAPPTRGHIEQTEISGRLLRFTQRVVRMTRDVRPALNKRVQPRDEEEPEIIESEGFITEMDLDNETCMLRDENGSTIYKLRYAHEFPIIEPAFENVKLAFDNGQPVKIVGFRLVPESDLYLYRIRLIEHGG